MEDKTRRPEPETTQPVHEMNTHETHAPEHEDEHQHGNPQFALKVLLILIAIILVILVLKATGVPFAVKDWLSHFTESTVALRGVERSI